MSAPNIYVSVIDLLERQLKSAAPEEIERWVPTTCGYCAVGCRLFVGLVNGEVVTVKGDVSSPINQGKLCLKGRYQWKALQTPGRAAIPLVRRRGRLEPATWDEALALVAAKIKEVRASLGPEGLAVYSSGLLTLEEQYAIGKLARGFLKTPYLDANTRLCMSSTVAGFMRSFGQDGPPGCYEDLEIADCLLLFGCNPAEMHPNLWRKIILNKERRGAYLIAADPRTTATVRQADLHLALRPGSNVALLQGLLHVLIRDGLIDSEFIEAHTEGFTELAASVQGATPEVSARKTGLKAEDIVACAHRFGRSGAAVTVFAQGVNQSAQSTETVNLICNLHLITGKIGKPGSAPLSLTGQVAAMSNREVGGGGSLAGYRRWDDPKHRAEVARLWGIPAEDLPGGTKDIESALQGVEAGTVGFLWNIGTNPAVSLPDQAWTRAQLDKVFCVVQDVFYPMETAAFADVFLPAAQWGEKTGTYTNGERRVSLGRRAVQPPSGALTDLEIVQEIARCLGFERAFAWKSPEAVFEEWKRLSRGRPVDMSGLSYERLDREGGVQWPCPAVGHPGTARLYEQGQFPTESGKAKLWAVTEVVEEKPGAYPFILNTGRIREHFHSRTKTKRIAELNLLSAEGYAEIAYDDAARLGIVHHDWIQVVTETGWIRVRAKVTTDTPPGSVFVPFHFGDLDPGEAHLKQAANHLVSCRTDPYSKQPRYKLGYCRIEKE